MATMSDSFTRVLRVLQDEEKRNYQVPELSQYANLAISYLSRELAKWGSRIDVETEDQAFSTGIYSASLPSDFLSIALNEKSAPRVFNASNSYAAMDRAEPSEMDNWQTETAADDGTPDAFIINGQNLIIHPRPESPTTIRLYYHPLRAIVDDSSTAPFGGWFADPIEQFILRQCRLRSEMGAFFQVDVADYHRLSAQCYDILQQREGRRILMEPAECTGWGE